VHRLQMARALPPVPAALDVLKVSIDQMNLGFGAMTFFYGAFLLDIATERLLTRVVLL